MITEELKIYDEKDKIEEDRNTLGFTQLPNGQIIKNQTEDDKEKTTFYPSYLG